MNDRNLVLIETYWNVKIDICTQTQRNIHGINRNILECKDIRQNRKIIVKTSINRNILECKEAY